MNFPFRILGTQKTIYAPSKKQAELDCGKTVIPLVNICLVVPAEALPTHTVIHQTGAHHLTVGRTEGKRWVTPCNAKKKPAVITSVPKAASCQKCLEWVESLKVTDKNPIAKSLEEELEKLE